MNGVLAPKSIVVEVADPVPQGGRQNLKTHYGECPEMLPGFVLPACSQRVPCEQGRAVGFKRMLVGSAKPRRREGPNDLAAVRLADSTPRSGEPATWGSGQRALNCSKATWPPCKGRCRVGGDVAIPTPHRPGRADSPHPVLHEGVLLAEAYPWRILTEGSGCRASNSLRRAHVTTP